VISGFDHPDLCPAAAVSLRDISDSCKDVIALQVPLLIEFFKKLKPHVRARERVMVIESIANLLQVLPPGKLEEATLVLTEGTLQSMSTTLQMSSSMVFFFFSLPLFSFLFSLFSFLFSLFSSSFLFSLFSFLFSLFFIF
jgi:hypothetical protein